MWFVAYEWSKRHLTELTAPSDSPAEKNSHDTAGQEAHAHDAFMPTWFVPVCAGAFAATVAWAVGYPADTIKTRIQAVSLSGGRVPGMMETAAAMVRETGGGVTVALYRGFGLKLLRAVPASAVAFFAYEESRRWIESNHPSPSGAAAAADDQERSTTAQK